MTHELSVGAILAMRRSGETSAHPVLQCLMVKPVVEAPMKRYKVVLSDGITFQTATHDQLAYLLQRPSEVSSKMVLH